MKNEHHIVKLQALWRGYNARKLVAFIKQSKRVNSNKTLFLPSYFIHYELNTDLKQIVDRQQVFHNGRIKGNSVKVSQVQSRSLA